jgi:hypothetical protein
VDKVVGMDETLTPADAADVFRPEEPKLYEPQVTFRVPTLSHTQRRELRTVLHILRLIENRVRAYGSVRKASRHLGVSKTFLHRVLQRKAPPGYKLARAVGYAPKVLYLRVPRPSELPMDFKKAADDRLRDDDASFE